MRVFFVKTVANGLIGAFLIKNLMILFLFKRKTYRGQLSIKTVVNGLIEGLFKKTPLNSASPLGIF